MPRTPDERGQALVVRLPVALSRAVRDLVLRKDSAYRTVDEFFEVAVLNQLALDDHVDAGHDLERPQAPRNLLGPVGGIPEVLPTPPDRPRGGLFMLTNRLGPVKIACRVLANLWSENHEDPATPAFQAAAADAARELGLRLQKEDQAQRRVGRSRRAIGFPTGPSAEKALDRYISSYTILPKQDVPDGPLAVLGLVEVKDGRVRLTKAGWGLAKAPSPLLSEDESDACLSGPEAVIVRTRLQKAPEERARVEQLMRVLVDGAVEQDEIDAALAEAYPGWSENKLVAHRAALLGRLEDAQMVTVEGRGRKARVEMTTEGQEWLEAGAHR